MTIVNRSNVETIEAPEQLHYWNVMYWDPISRGLLMRKNEKDDEAATLLTKAQKFLEFDCVEKTDSGSWIVKPIQGYNKTTYKVVDGDNGFVCNCQGYKGNKFCSHCLAVTQYEYMTEYNAKNK